MKRFSISDGILLFLLLFGLIGAAWRMGTLREEPEEARVSVILLQRQIYAETAERIHVGALLYNSAGEYWGTVKTVVIQPARVTLWEAGEACVGEWEDCRMCDVRVTVEVAGRWRDGCFLEAGRTPIAVGSVRVVTTSDVTLTASVEKVVSLAP